MGVKTLSESIGGKICIPHIAGLAGMLHDMGKFTDEFRNYILEAVENPDAPPKKGSVDHSTAGGKLLYEMFHRGTPSKFEGILAEVVGNAIISHHSYLHDFLSPNLESPYLKRVQKDENQLKEYASARDRFFERVIPERKFLEYVAKAVEELEKFLIASHHSTAESKLMFLSKFIFSALIDADRTNTRLFEEDRPDERAESTEDLFRVYHGRVMDKLRQYEEQDGARTELNALRSAMSAQCERFAENPPGVYTLSIPTGGGKTLASLRYALKHAVMKKKKHIVYVVPYTTIIEQNAGEIRTILKDSTHVLEHHSNVVEDENDDDESQDGLLSTQQKLKLAKDNWDSPIIFTTMVQFLNVFYAKGSRNIRRLHNLSESVIIFDEVQKVPLSCVSLFNQTLNFLKFYGRSTLVLCTATQPALDFIENKLETETDAEMITDIENIRSRFKRVEIVDKATEKSIGNAELTDFILRKTEDFGSVLAILNTKAVVSDLFQRLKDTGLQVFQLSTSMCAAHRTDVLRKIRGMLDRKEQVVCVSTQLIEAGVDISFDCVIRSLAGLDSIAQASGRCNRHGEHASREVYVIQHGEENLSHLPEIRVGKEISRRILLDLNRDRQHHGGDILSGAAMNRYFRELYTEFRQQLNYFVRPLEKDMTELLASDRGNNSYNIAYRYETNEVLPLFVLNSYRTAAEHFHVIDNQTTSVIAPYGDEGREIIARLNGGETIADLDRLMRRAQQYSVGLFRHELDRLVQNEGLTSLLNGQVLALKESAYNEEFGLDLHNDTGLRDLMI